jgi:1-pyrroline-5-carboxylate dehydrogenase
MDGLTQVPVPRNEPVLGYGPGSAERETLLSALAEMAGAPVDLPMTIGGAEVAGRGKRFELTRPYARRQVLGVMRFATQADARSAVDAALAAAPDWRALSFTDRAAVFLKAADLLAGP